MEQMCPVRYNAAPPGGTLSNLQTLRLSPGPSLHLVGWISFSGFKLFFPSSKMMMFALFCRMAAHPALHPILDNPYLTLQSWWVNVCLLPPRLWWLLIDVVWLLCVTRFCRINSCVGQANHRSFVLTLAVFVLTSLYGIALVLSSLCPRQHLATALFYCPAVYSQARYNRRFPSVNTLSATGVSQSDSLLAARRCASPVLGSAALSQLDCFTCWWYSF